MAIPPTDGSDIAWATSQFKSTFLTVGLFSMVMNLMLLVPSIYMLQVYDRVLPSRNETTLWMLTAIALGLYGMSALLDYVRAMAVSRVSRQVDALLAWRTCEAAFQQNLKHPRAHGTQAFNDLNQLRQFIGGPAFFAFFDAPWLPVYLAVIFLFSPWLGWLAIAGTLVLVALALANEWLTAKPLADSHQSAMKATQMAAGTVRHAEVVKSMGMLRPLFQRWRGFHELAIEQQICATDRAHAIGAATRFVRLSLQSLVLGVGALLVLNNAISPGMMIAASILMGRALSPVEQVIAVWRQWGSTREAHRRLDRLLRDTPVAPQSLDLPTPRGRVDLEHLSAVPPGGSEPVLKQLNLSLNPGEVLGVLGPSGSGKSSLARVLTGVWPASHGSMRLDGAELSQYDPDQLGAHLGYLPQTVELFEGTVAENIARFGETNADLVVKAAVMAGVHDLILRLPKGYETPVGDAGAGLSGGQRQRIALARALYGSPRLIVLDEPNAHLDEAGEQALVQAVVRLRESGSTVVLITHRGSTLSVADKLLVLRDGQVQMFGPKDQLLNSAKTGQVAAPAHFPTTQTAPDHAA